MAIYGQVQCSVCGKQFLGNPESGRQVCLECWGKLKPRQKQEYVHPKKKQQFRVWRIKKLFGAKHCSANIREVSIDEFFNQVVYSRTISRIGLHHTADQGAAGDLSYWRRVQEYHIYHNGWADIGYHAGMSRSGVLYQLRNLNMRGAHCIPMNGDSIGTCFAGNFEIDEPTPQMAALFVPFAIRGGQRFGFSLPQGITFHRDLEATACPGAKITHELINLWFTGGIEMEVEALGKEDRDSPVYIIYQGNRYYTVDIQTLLLKWRPNCLPNWGADGDFYTETETAVKAFQEANGCKVDGLVGQETIGKLVAITLSPPVVQPTPQPEPEPTPIIPSPPQEEAPVPQEDEETKALLKKILALLEQLVNWFRQIFRVS